MDIKSHTLASMKDNKFQNEDSFSIEDQSENTAGNQTEYTAFAGSNSTQNGCIVLGGNVRFQLETKWRGLRQFLFLHVRVTNILPTSPQAHW